jgi:hypothetical protein
MSDFPRREIRTDVTEGDSFSVGSVEMSYTIEMMIGSERVSVKVINFSENGLRCACSQRVEIDKGDKCQLVSQDKTLVYSVRWVSKHDHQCEFGILLEPDSQ